MRFYKGKFKTFGMLLTFAAAIGLSLFAAGCGNSNGVAVATNGVSGVANKGPFQTGSTVTAYQLNTQGVRTGVTSTATVTDNLGSYAISGLSWSGLTEVEIVGLYLDENTGAVSGTQATMSAIINLPAATTAVTSQSANPNLASTVAASVAKKQLLTALTGTSISNVLQSANQAAATALGLPSTINGLPIDLSQLNVTNTADPVLGAASQQLLIASAAMLGVGGDITVLTTSLATDVNTGKALGSTSGQTAAIVTSQNNLNLAAIAANITAAGGTPAANLAAALPAASTIVSNNASTVLRGLAMAGNTFTVGPVTYNVAATGVGTAGAGTILANNVVLGFTLKDYSNVAGTGSKAATYAVSVSFDIAATVGTRRIVGSVSPVTVITDGAGKVSVSVPANAVLTYNGTDSLGLNVVGTATNLAANLIQTNANVLNIDANALLTTIQNKVGAQSASLNVLSTAGTFNFTFAISGLNIGSENGGATGISQLFPTVVGGRGVSGTIIAN